MVGEVQHSNKQMEKTQADRQERLLQWMSRVRYHRQIILTQGVPKQFASTQCSWLARWLMDDTAGLQLLNAGPLTLIESRADTGGLYLRCKCGM